MAMIKISLEKDPCHFSKGTKDVPHCFLLWLGLLAAVEAPSASMHAPFEQEKHHLCAGTLTKANRSSIFLSPDCISEYDGNVHFRDVRQLVADAASFVGRQVPDKKGPHPELLHAICLNIMVECMCMSV